MRRAGIQRRKRRTGKTARTERRGYYIGFLVVAFLISLFCGNGKMLHSRQRSLIVVGIPVIYAFGAGWMKHVTGQPWGAVIVRSIIPFIPLDIVKCVAAVALERRWKRTGLFGN
ncbi:MAG: biotin transporter BioY [Clostridium fessum]